MQFWRFLESVEDSFLTQMTEDSMRTGALLDLIITNKEGLVGDMEVEGSLGCSEYEVVEFRILRRRIRAKSKITTLDFKRADFGLFKDLLIESHGITPWMDEWPMETG